MKNCDYDNLNRLQSVVTHYANGVAADPVSLTYDHSGNIKSKSDVGLGAYHYDNVYNSSNPCGINPHQAPHSLNSIAGYADFCYDANGNMTHDKNIDGATRNLTYSAFGKPERITREHNGNLARMDFTYGVNQQRVTRQDYQNGNLVESTTYVDTRYEQVVSSSGEITHKAYIGDFAMIKKVEPTPALPITPKETFYFHRDHQNSIVNISDDLGISKECLSQDVWGKRRLCNWQPDENYLNFTSSITNRGYTSHEHLDAVGLIHMNARVYDPVIGRFMSADDVVPDASDMQALNRYAYVRNNPATLRDPTGHSWAAFAKFVEAVFVAIVVTEAVNILLTQTFVGRPLQNYMKNHPNTDVFKAIEIITFLWSIHTIQQRANMQGMDGVTADTTVGQGAGVGSKQLAVETPVLSAEQVGMAKATAAVATGGNPVTAFVGGVAKGPMYEADGDSVGNDLGGSRVNPGSALKGNGGIDIANCGDGNACVIKNPAAITEAEKLHSALQTDGLGFVSVSGGSRISFDGKNSVSLSTGEKFEGIGFHNVEKGARAIDIRFAETGLDRADVVSYIEKHTSFKVLVNKNYLQGVSKLGHIHLTCNSQACIDF